MARPSSVIFEEEQDSTPSIATLTDPITLCQGITERGPLTPLLCRSDTEFFTAYGNYTPDNFETLANVKQYFDNGGKLLVFCRVTHLTDPTDPTTTTCATGTLNLSTPALTAAAAVVTGTIAAPYNLEPGDTLTVSRDALGNATATFTAVAATRTSTGAAPFALANNDVLTVALDGGANQLITFTTGQFVSIGAATAAEVVAVINAQIVGGKAAVSGSNVAITSDRRGSGSGVNVVAGGAQASGKLNITAGNVAGTGNVSNIDMVTSAEIKSVVEAAVSGVTVSNVGGLQRITSNTTGNSSLVQVIATSSADDELGLDNAIHNGNNVGAQATLRVDGKTPGAFANELFPVVAPASTGAANTFDLYVQRAGVLTEKFEDLSMDPLNPRYALTIVNSATVGIGSNLIALTDLAAPVGVPGNIPAAGTFGPLSGGSDGLAGIVDNDFIGGTGANGKTGLRAFDIEDGDMLMSPQRATPAVHNAMVTYCETTRNGMIYPIYDMPAGLNSIEADNYVRNTALLFDLTEFGCIDWPRIKVSNPNNAVYGDADTLVCPTSGMIAGLCSRVEGAREVGVFDQPGGPADPYLPINVRGLETDEVLDDDVRGFIFACNINPITRKRSKLPGANGQFGPIYVDGVRNLSITGNWPSIGQRRGIIWTKKQLDAVLDPTRQRNITDDLITAEQDKADTLMRAITRAGALATNDPNTAYILDWGSGQNTASTRRAGQTHGRVGIATANANEFIFVKIGPDNRALQAELAAQ